MISEKLRHDNWSEVDWHYIKGLSDAIEKVQRKYVCITKDDQLFHLEHVFAYELYYKWRGVLRRKGGNPQKLILNGELSKHYCKTSCYRFPDLVLHKQYEKSKDDENQFVICEIKSSRHRITTKALEKDVKSLFGGITDLSYKCGVFIYLGIDFKHIIHRMREIIRKLELNTEKRIIFVGVDGNEYQYEIL